MLASEDTHLLHPSQLRRTEVGQGEREKGKMLGALGVIPGPTRPAQDHQGDRAASCHVSKQVAFYKHTSVRIRSAGPPGEHCVAPGVWAQTAGKGGPP